MCLIKVICDDIDLFPYQVIVTSNFHDDIYAPSQHHIYKFPPHSATAESSDRGCIKCILLVNHCKMDIINMTHQIVS